VATNVLEASPSLVDCDGAFPDYHFDASRVALVHELPVVEDCSSSDETTEGSNEWQQMASEEHSLTQQSVERSQATDRFAARPNSKEVVWLLDCGVHRDTAHALGHASHFASRHSRLREARVDDTDYFADEELEA
jgi:hypothetical protein